jgi:ADP-heptose:LPS heptosyltransferase
MMSAPRILICRTDAIGDNVLSLTVADDVKSALPQSSITWMAAPRVAPLIDLDRNVDAVIEWDGLCEPLGLFEQLDRRFDAVLVLHPKPKYWLVLAPMLKRARIPVRVGTGRRWWGAWYYTHRVWVTRHRDGMHECTRAREHGRVLIRALGGDPRVCDRPPRTGLSVPRDALAQAGDFFARHGLQRPVLLHVGSNGSAADWPVAHMAALADALAERGVAVLVSTGWRRGDLEQAMREACRYPPVYTPAEPTLAQLAAWATLAGCFVAGSTGPLHLAGALGVPTVGLFPCVKDCFPQQWGPLGEQAINLVAPTPPQGMYARRRLTPPEHMATLSVDAVLLAVLRQLGR